MDRATSEERRRKCPIERAEEGSAMEEEGEGDGIYNIYVSSAIRRCLLASLRASVSEVRRSLGGGG